MTRRDALPIAYCSRTIQWLRPHRHTRRTSSRCPRARRNKPSSVLLHRWTTIPRPASMRTSRIVAISRRQWARALSPFAGRWIRHSGAVDARERREPVVLRLAGREDVNDPHATRDEGVREQPAMALPRQRFRAHDGRPPVSRNDDESIQSGGELGSVHVVRVASKSAVVPSRVRAVMGRLAESAEILEVFVGDAPVREGPRERDLRSPRHSSGPGKVPDVGQQPNSIFFEEGEEFLERSGRMADGPERLIRPAQFSSQGSRRIRRRVAQVKLAGDNLSVDLKRPGPDAVIQAGPYRAGTGRPEPQGLCSDSRPR